MSKHNSMRAVCELTDNELNDLIVFSSHQNCDRDCILCEALTEAKFRSLSEIYQLGRAIQEFKSAIWKAFCDKYNSIRRAIKIRYYKWKIRGIMVRNYSDNPTICIEVLSNSHALAVMLVDYGDKLQWRRHGIVIYGPKSVAPCKVCANVHDSS